MYRQGLSNNAGLGAYKPARRLCLETKRSENSGSYDSLRALSVRNLDAWMKEISKAWMQTIPMLRDIFMLTGMLPVSWG